MFEDWFSGACFCTSQSSSQPTMFLTLSTTFGHMLGKTELLQKHDLRNRFRNYNFSYRFLSLGKRSRLIVKEMSNVSKTIVEYEPPKAKKLKNLTPDVVSVSANDPNFLNSMLALMDQNMNNVPSPPSLKSLGKIQTTEKKKKKVSKAIVPQSEKSGSKVVSWRKPLTEVRVYEPL